MFGGGLGIVAAKAGNTGEVIGTHLLPFNDALVFWQQYFDEVYEALLAQFPHHVIRPNVEQAVNLGAKRTSKGVEIAIYRS